MKERVTLIARGARLCDSRKGYEPIGEENMDDKKKRGKSKSTSKKSADSSVLSAAAAQSNPSNYLIFEVVPRSTFSDPLS